MHQFDKLSENLAEGIDIITEKRKFSAEAIRDWRTHPITQVMFLEFREKQLDAVRAVLEGVDNGSGALNIPRGKALGIEDLFEWEPPGVNENDG